MEESTTKMLKFKLNLKLKQYKLFGFFICRRVKGELSAVFFLKLSSSLNLCSVCPLLSLLHSGDVDNDDDDDDDDEDVNDSDGDSHGDMMMMTMLRWWWLGLLS